MSITINSINFPDQALRNYVKNTLAGGRSTLTDDMLLGVEHTVGNPLSLVNLGIKDITGIDLLFVKNLSAYPVYINLQNNNVSDIDVHALYEKIGRIVEINFSFQFVNFAGKEVTVKENQTYPYQLNLGKYLSNPSSRIKDVEYLYIDGSGYSHNYQISGDILMMKGNPYLINYTLDSLGKADGASPQQAVHLIRDPYICTRKANVKRKRGEKCNIQFEIADTWSISDTDDTQIKGVGTTLPVTWSISKGELPPGLSLNSSTGLISGIPI